MKINKEQKEKARAIADKYGVEKVYVNDKGEYFTRKDYAFNSVGGDIKRLAQAYPAIVAAEPKPEAPKPEETKPEELKSEETVPEETVPEDQKTEEPKPATNKKTTNNKKS